MRNKRSIALYCLVGLLSFVLVSCGKKADENKPLGEVKAEAEKMDVSQLQSMAMQYKDAIAAKTSEVSKMTAKLKEIPVTEMLGSEAKGLQADIGRLTESLTSLMERFQVYYQKIKEKGGDVSGLDI